VDKPPKGSTVASPDVPVQILLTYGIGEVEEDFLARKLSRQFAVWIATLNPL
jgi:hypothetical protein